MKQFYSIALYAALVLCPVVAMAMETSATPPAQPPSYAEATGVPTNQPLTARNVITSLGKEITICAIKLEYAEALFKLAEGYARRMRYACRTFRKGHPEHQKTFLTQPLSLATFQEFLKGEAVAHEAGELLCYAIFEHIKTGGQGEQNPEPIGIIRLGGDKHDRVVVGAINEHAYCSSSKYGYAEDLLMTEYYRVYPEQQECWLINSCKEGFRSHDQPSSWWIEPNLEYIEIGLRIAYRKPMTIVDVYKNSLSDDH